jgi:hypothetical protein
MAVNLIANMITILQPTIYYDEQQANAVIFDLLWQKT